LRHRLRQMLQNNERENQFTSEAAKEFKHLFCVLCG
jgi:hypothetical protein